METIEARWAKLWPHVIQMGPDDGEARPAVLLFHGCGGVRQHLRRYGTAAVEAGCRAFLVDSYAPRGWSRRFASLFVCPGLGFRGGRRAGDVLAAVWGIAQLPGVDADRIALAGWSHGSWSIMDLMTMDLDRRGEARLINPTPAPVRRIKGLFLAYPYLGLIARSWRKIWRYNPKVFAIIPTRDHLGSVQTHMRAYASAVAAGSDVEIWSVAATHAFDEPGLRVPKRLMEHDPELLDASIERFVKFLTTEV